MRVEHRVPGGDVNQYMAVSGLIAAGIYGIENELELEEMTTGNAYAADKPHVPATLREAADLFENSAIARAAFGDDVVDHYVHSARTEIAAFDRAITDWERVRGFERL
jgi:glutamine synthetase